MKRVAYLLLVLALTGCVQETCDDRRAAIERTNQCMADAGCKPTSYHYELLAEDEAYVAAHCK